MIRGRAAVLTVSQLNRFVRSTLEENPQLEPALRKMEGLITESEMQQLNARVEAGEEDAAVAEDFLTQKGLLD